MGSLELFRAELGDRSWLEVLVEQPARVLPPLVVWRETERPTEAHADEPIRACSHDRGQLGSLTVQPSSADAACVKVIRGILITDDWRCLTYLSKWMIAYQEGRLQRLCCCIQRDGTRRLVDG